MPARRRLFLIAPLLSLLAVPPMTGAAGARTPVAAPAAAAAQRVLPLQGGNNFRDLGGYRTADGRSVRWGLLYRSAAMDKLTLADFQYLNGLGIRTICDLRDRRERASQALAWPKGLNPPRVLADDYDLDMTGFAVLFGGASPPDAATARQVMAKSYPAMLARFNGQYRRMFAELLAGEAPLAFNCSAGKDRTGIAAALLLTALGVPRETVIDDYLLSNRYFDPHKGLATDDRAGAMWRRLPPDVLRVLMGVDRSYLEAVFQVIDAHPGGVDGYLDDRLGLDAAARRKLAALYTR